MKTGSSLLVRLAVRCLMAGALAAPVSPGWAADNQSLAINAVVLSKSNCKFNSGSAVLDFQTVNPWATTPYVATAKTFFKCAGSAVAATYTLAAGNGLWYSGGRQMRHSVNAAAFLAYSLSLSPSSGTAAKNVDVEVTITGTIDPSSFANAIAGFYSDTVAITVSP